MKAYVLVMLLFIPLSAEAGEATATMTLRRGTVLNDSHISLQKNDGESLVDLRKNFVGLELNRTIYAGRVIDLSYLSAPTLIKRNAQINMVYSSGTLRLTAKGKALETGTKGDLISVMNLSSRKKISATVTGIDTVEVR